MKWIKMNMIATVPTRLLTVLSSPPCGALASTETVTNAPILAFTSQPAVWSIHVIITGYNDMQKG